MKPLPIEFEPNASFCYKFARYHLLPELAQEPEALSGEPFKLNSVINRVLSRYLTDEQMGMSYPARDTEGKMHPVGGAIRFFISLRAKRGSESPFVWLGQSGMYRLKSDIELTQEAAEDVDEAIEELADVEFDGWIYAFTFPSIKDAQNPFPIKIGLTTAADVETRVFGQCKGSGFFENLRFSIVGRSNVLHKLKTPFMRCLKLEGAGKRMRRVMSGLLLHLMKFSLLSDLLFRSDSTQNPL